MSLTEFRIIPLLRVALKARGLQLVITSSKEFIRKTTFNIQLNFYVCRNFLTKACMKHSLLYVYRKIHFQICCMFCDIRIVNAALKAKTVGLNERSLFESENIMNKKKHKIIRNSFDFGFFGLASITK